MGALHEGHSTLIRTSVAHHHSTVVSIFVNPTQFNQRSDFEHYPRTEEQDLSLCDSLGVDAVYLPDVVAMYPTGSTTTIDPGPLATVLEGASRPGHFAGVATVVVKLLATVEPDESFFGEKDLQQLAVIRRVVSDLDIASRITGVATVRENDGLAMSSRNVRLSVDDRLAARCISRALFSARQAAIDGVSDTVLLRTMLHETLAREPSCRLDYAEIVDDTNFASADQVGATTWACVAAWFGEVRLIDNICLSST